MTKLTISSTRSGALGQEAHSKKNLSDIDCQKLEKGYADCQVPKHQIKTVEGYTKAFLAVLNLIRGFAIFCGGGCVASFFLRPLIYVKKDT